MPTYGDNSYGTVATYGGAQTYQPSATEVAGTAGNILGATGTMIQVAGGPPQNPIVAAIMGGLQVFGGVGELGGAIITDVGTDGATTGLSIPVAVNGVANIVGGIGQIMGLFQDNQVQFKPPGVPATPAFACDICAAIDRILLALDPTGGATAHFKTSLGLDASDIGTAVWGFSSFQWSSFYGAMVDDLWAIISNHADNHGIRLNPFGWFRNVDSMTTGNPPTDLGLHPNPANIGPTDTLITWLTSELPAYTWAVDATSHYVKGTGTGAGAHSVFCAITGPQFEWLKNYMYTPSSGPPKRSLVADWDLMFAMIPINF